MCLWRAVLSMLKCWFPFLFGGHCGGGKVWRKWESEFKKGKRYICPHVHPNPYLTLYWNAFFLINGRQNKGVHDHTHTWAILWIDSNVQKSQKHIATHNYVINWMYMSKWLLTSWMLVEICLQSWGTDVSRWVEKGRGEYSRKDASGWFSRASCGFIQLEHGPRCPEISIQCQSHWCWTVK